MKTNTDASPMSGLIGMGEKEIGELAEMALRLFQSYNEKSAEVSDQAWLAEKLLEEIPECSLEEIKILIEEIMTDIEEFDQALASLEEACKQGQSKEEWFRDQSQLAAIGMNVNDYGNKLANIDRALFMTNCQLLRLLAAQEEKCPQHFTLDSFIAEQLHVISFNAHAVEANSPYRAEIFVPNFEQGYDAGTPDVIIKDTQTGKKVLSYRVKFGGKEELSNLTQNDNANVPCIVVATEQLEEMRTAFPKHVFTDRIGDTEKISARSDAMARENVWEQKALERYPIERNDWNSSRTRDLALRLGQNAALAGAGNAIFYAKSCEAEYSISYGHHPMPVTVEHGIPRHEDAARKIVATGISIIALQKLAPKIPFTRIANYCGFDAIGAGYRPETGIAMLDQIEKTIVARIYVFCWKDLHPIKAITLFSIVTAISSSIANHLADINEHPALNQRKYLEICKTSIKSKLCIAKKINRVEE